MKRRARERRGMSAGRLARNLAVVLGACLLIRAAADAAAGGAFPGIPERLGAALLSAELPFARKDTGEAWEQVASGELSGGSAAEKPKNDAPLRGERETDPADPSGETIPTDPPPESGPTDPPPESAPTQPSAPAAPETPLKDAISTTIRGSGEGYQGIYIKNKTDYEVDVEELLSKPLPFGEKAAVLIVHTHASEAYNPAGEDIYQESDPSRTEDTRYNVVRVGDELEAVLKGRGVTVYHDRELHDYPSYTGAYNRSMASVLEQLSEHPEIRVVIDLHRDALEGDGKLYKTVAKVGDAPCAQVMLICGTDFSGLEHPNWKENMSLALKLQSRMAKLYPTLARPLKLSQYRYNQHVSTGALIAEIGTNGNTLREAVTAVRYFGECLADVLAGET